ncbi:hypothetical protein [Phormidium sp. CCY1219]|uniref:hypothetical protein n=1 Tax=Phormidium sp. CCY1219 TaxID=2886104 RepID=UPI002D1EDDFF|nr:hypothetical protein [Phormidium sp. CCY1219]MEB3826677.1 hypothetical protein [Phormidium sp. CCY1219]
MAITLWKWLRKWLKTDIRDINWGETLEDVKTGSEAGQAVFEMAEVVQDCWTCSSRANLSGAKLSRADFTDIV